MLFQKAALIFALVFVVSVNGRYTNQPSWNFYETPNILEGDIEDQIAKNSFYGHPMANHVRVARQSASMSTNSDGSMNLNMKAPLADNDKNVLSAIGGIGGFHMDDQKYGIGSVTGGLALDNENGHGLSLTGTHLPGLGNQLTGAGRFNLLHTDNHNLDANAFVSHTFSSVPDLPDFTTRGGSMNYMYKDKVGASLAVANTPLFRKTDYSAMGNLNLYRTPHSSLDLNAGVTKSVSPFSSSSWEPKISVGHTWYW